MIVGELRCTGCEGALFVAEGKEWACVKCRTTRTVWVEPSTRAPLVLPPVTTRVPKALAR